MKREADETESAALDGEFGSVPTDQETLADLSDSVITIPGENFVRCVWRSDNCQYCQRPDGTWVFIRCLG